MTMQWTLGDGIKGNRIIVVAESIRKDPGKRIKLTSAHTGERARARGEAYAYIDKAFESVPRSARPR